MTFSKAGSKKRFALRKTVVGTTSLLLAGAFLFGGGAVHANQANKKAPANSREAVPTVVLLRKVPFLLYVIHSPSNR